MKHMKLSKIGSAILKEISGMRPIDLANGIGVSKSHLNYIITGERRFSLKVAKRLAELTSISAREWCIMQLDHELPEDRAEGR